MISCRPLASVRGFATTAGVCRVSDQYVKQFRLPGRTNSALSTGVVPYPNDPMLPRGKYFKPRGLDQESKIMMQMLGQNPQVFKYNVRGLMLCAYPWGRGEHPRDYNGLRIRDYRVAVVATKKSYDKKAHPRWRITRLLRTAASLVLPDKGLRRCDYLLYAHAELQQMTRDEIFLQVERAVVSIEAKIWRSWAATGQKKQAVDRAAFLQGARARAEAHSSSDKILNVELGGERRPVIRSMSDIVEDQAQSPV
ncbi:hypothetical protein GGF46_004678 [Coemansia sp. RSA 552]|nr:hypothetical protein GGF46_004678 [Coemansia sp. RSA 552]